MSFFKTLWERVVGTSHEREVRALQPLVARIGALEDGLKGLSDAELAARTPALRSRLAAGETEQELLPEAFALVREAARRVVGMRHFDVQLLGGMVLHSGKIAEMRTGEGKTLVATLPVYLAALAGKGVHVVTVNDYLARRDAEWMGRIYQFLGMSVGVIVHDLSDEERRLAYACDITYGTNNEFGFDYLRDNMKFSREEQVQRGHQFAIVDEVDSILIDEARTPLIISGATEESTDKYYLIDDVVPHLRREIDFVIDEKARVATLTDEGIARVEKRLGLRNLYDPSNVEVIHHVNQALRAHVLYKRDVDYVVQEGEVVIVDEFTGRLMPGRRWSDGLHQAIEAKERVKIQNENQTLASITFQNYFRLYQKLAGMTGTAVTEADEFEKIYHLQVVAIPTHRPMVRKDHPDVVYKTEEDKLSAITEEIAAEHERGRPVLVGTVSIEKSERISRRLAKKGIPHHVLNAKHHEKEAEIVAQAGRLGAVTIATNMAGRGTDILLGGNPTFLARAQVGAGVDEPTWQEALARMEAQCAEEHARVVAVGGLHILGTERHESRRIDNQLRGRAGRQGDPGSSRFYLSLEDELLRVFGGERISGFMDTVGVTAGEAIEHAWLSRAIENAQKKLEGHHFGVRKQLTEFDTIMNQQRSVIYGIRQKILEEPTRPMVEDMFEGLAADLTAQTWPSQGVPELGWAAALAERLQAATGLTPTADQLEASGADELQGKMVEYLNGRHRARAEEFGEEQMAHLERFLLLHTLDVLWKEHLLEMDNLRDKVGLSGYAQQQPLQVYRKEGFELFQSMMADRERAVIERLFRVQLVREPAPAPQGTPARRPEPAPDTPGFSRGLPELHAQPIRREARPGRNDPCHCGSGKKYKKCHMAQDEAAPFT